GIGGGFLLLCVGHVGYSLTAQSSSCLHFVEEFRHGHYRAIYGASSDLLDVIACGHSERVEAAVKGLQHCFGKDMRSYSAGGAMLNVDCRAYRDFSVVAMRLKGQKCCGLHQANHVRGGIYRRQLGMMRG